MIDKQPVSINLGIGMDTKTDAKAVVSSKAILLQDSIFTKAKRWTKRNGYDAMTLNEVGGGTISNPQMVEGYKNELVAAATGSNGPRLFSYSPSLSGWSDRGKYNSVAVSKSIIASPEEIFDGSHIVGVSNPSSATLNNISLYAFDSDCVWSGFGAFAAYIVVVDNNTGMKIPITQPQNGNSSSYIFEVRSDNGYSPGSGFATILGYSKAVLLGSSQLAVFYVSQSTPTGGTYYTDSKLCYRLVTVTQAGGAIVGAETVVGVTLTTGTVGTNNGIYYGYDVVTTSGGAFVAVANEPKVDLYTVSSSGALSGPTSITSTGIICPVSVSLDPSGTNAWIYWGSANTDMYYAVYNSSSRALVLGATHSLSALTALTQISALAVSSTQQIAYYSEYTQPAILQTAGVYYPIISSQTVNVGGTFGGDVLVISGVDIYSKPFTASGRNYIGVMSISPNNPTGFILDLADAIGAAKFLPLEAEGVYSPGYNAASGTPVPPVARAIRYPSFLNSFHQSGSIYYLACGFVVSLETIVPVASGGGAVYPTEATVGAIMGVSSMGFDFGNIDAFQSIVQQDTLLLNGGIVSQYDGAYVSELGFNTDPDGLSAFVTSSGGSLAAGTYTYFFVYRWTDSLGNLHQSAPSTGLNVVIGAGAASSIVAVTVNGLTLTQKKNVIIEFYRTTNGGTIPFLIRSISNVLGYTGISDQAADANIQVNPQLYTEGGAVLENIAPPPSMVLWTNNNRAWCIDSENPETTIEYTKTASAGTGISFSTGELEVIVDSKGGAITGASPMDEKTVILKENAVGYFIGDGANDAGTGSTITQFQFIPSDCGCTNSKSVLLYPGGVIFRSSKGLYQVNRGAQVNYFGIDVEQYNTQDVRSAQIISDKNQLRFLTSSGVSLLYDYVFSQWSVFTNHQGLSSTNYSGKYVYARSDGAIYIENPTSFLDATTAITPLAQTAWIKANSIQNFQRIRMVELLGDYAGTAGHGVQISIAYDWSPSFRPTSAYIFDGRTSFYQYRAFSPTQKCDAFQIQIQEITTGATGEYIDFTDLGIEIGAKRGLNKLPASRSVG